MAPALQTVRLPRPDGEPVGRSLVLCALAILVALGAAIAAEVLQALIGLITNLAYFHRWSTALVTPAGTTLGPVTIVIPVVGAVVVGLMARYGHAAVRGHGIPEAMERVLYAESRIAPRLTLLKPLSAAVSIGSGGPFGAEGPIIATGGALGSLLGQLLETTADERKALLAAGAAAGMAATFGTPVASVLLAVELLLFEYRPRSLIPVALAASAATAVRMAVHGSGPVFPMPDLSEPGAAALVAYLGLGAVVGVAAVGTTRAVYAVEDAFERLPIHWMWWPAIGAVVVGVLGWMKPAILGVGYDNIIGILGGAFLTRALVALVLLKLVAWAVALGSGTSGGTLAPLMTIGGGLGALLAAGLSALAPGAGIDPRIGALVGMAAMFAGASRAVLASVVFAFEATRQPLGLLPLLGGCSSAYLISIVGMRHSIMTERLARRGAPVRTEYSVDYLSQRLVRDHAVRDVAALAGERTVAEVREWIASGAAQAAHHGYPVVDANGDLIGVVTLRDIADPHADPAAPVAHVIKRPPAVIYEGSTLREAADHMVEERVGRLPVVRPEAPTRLVGMISRSDLLDAHGPRLAARDRATRSITLRPGTWLDIERRRRPRQPGA
jgi:H+/Cl- antiporter ClcA/CBS domain-containing protein